MAYENSKHYLHRCYRNGFEACLDDDDFCPHAQNSPEYNWWHDGWNEAATNYEKLKKEREIL